MGLTDQLRDSLSRNVRALAARVAGDVPTQMAGAPSRWGGPRTTRPQTATVKGLTPARIAALLQQADQGYPAAMCELIAEVERRDLTLLGLLSTRRRAVTALPWKIQPVDESPAALRTAEMVRKKILAIANFDDGLLHLMGALGPGYGAIELDWYNRKGDAGINRVIYRPQKWFRPDPDDPDAWRLLDVAAPMEGLPLPAWRFVVHVSLAVSGFPVEAGLGRALVWIFLYKNLAIKDWGTYGEIFGSPLRVGRYPAGTGGAEIEKLQTALDMLGVDASAVISSDMQVEFVGDKSGKSGPDVYERMVNLCNAEMAKGVLGQTLTTEAGSKGSQALGTVHNEVRRDILVSDARQLAKTITAQIVRPLVLFNVGPDEPIPAFILETDPPGDEKAEAETDKARADAQKVRAEVFATAAKLGIK
ncbi:MAG TPA: DUF935 family protein, partial [Myxococcota bacterium]|nr:DUF935 family protein [Myxococcota bacterium]